MNHKVGKKIISIILTFNLVIQNFVPLIIAPVYAAEEATPPAAIETPAPTPSDTPSPTPTVEPTPEVTPSVSPEPTVTPEITPSVTPDVSPTPAVEPTPVITPDPVATPSIELTPTIEITPTSTPEITPTPTSNPDSQAPPQNNDQQNNSGSQPSSSSPNTTTTNTEPTQVPESLTTISQLEQTLAPDPAPSLTTDKSDYFPTDTVYITGVNFALNTDYTLRISSTDNPLFIITPSVKSDENGKIEYSFTLDGNYRPNYTIEVLDSSNKEVASMTFTDSRYVGKIKINDKESDVVTSGSSVNIGVEVETDGWWFGDSNWESTSYKFGNESVKCDNSAKHWWSGKHKESFNVDAPLASGTYNLTLVAYSDDDCKVGASSPVTKLAALTVVSGPSWPTSWSTPNSCVSDPADDENPNEIDLIGSTGSPAVGFASDDTYQYFRERVHGNPGSASNPVEKAWVILFQTTGNQYQYLGSLNGKGDKVQLYQNTSPAGAVDFNPLLNDPAETLIWEGSSSEYARITSAGGSDYYVDWAIPVSQLSSQGISSSATKFFATSADANNYNKDHLKCYEQFADLSIVKTDSPDPVINGNTLTYTLTIHNAGPDTASGVVVTDTLPSGYSVTSVTPSKGSCSDTTAPSIQCELGTMTNGENATVTVVGTVNTSASSITNTASVNLDTTVSIDLNLSNNTDTEDTAVTRATGTLKIIKHVINDNGGGKTAGNFSLSISSAAGSSPTVSSITGNESGTDVILNPGSFEVTEPNHTGYSVSYDGCSGTIVAAQSYVCTVTNDDIAPKLTVTKIVTNNNGGTKTVTDFPLFVGTTPVTSGVENTFTPGAYTVSETGDLGYTGTISGNCASDGSITLALGDVKSCTITNDDKAASLTLVKTVINNNGGSLTSSNFPVFIDSTIAKWGTQSINAGTYTISETTQTGYSPSVWGGDCSANGSVTLLPGESKTCTITNDDIAPKLKLSKTVVNDNGGTKTAGDWTLTAQGTVLGFSDTGDSTSFHNVEAGVTYNLSESSLPSGYSASWWKCTGGEASGNTVKLALGEEVTCTITNDDIAPTITLTKVVNKDNGGTAGVNDFGLTIGDISVNSGETKTLEANKSYAINETGLPGYDFVSITGDAKCPKVLGGTVTLAPGENLSCTITNDDQASHLVVHKTTYPIGDSTEFSILATGSGTVSDAGVGKVSDVLDRTYDVTPGTYSVTESETSGWKEILNTCNRIEIKQGETKECSITNEKYSSISGHKYEVNADSSLVGGVSGWTIYLTQGDNTVSTTTDANGYFIFSNLLHGVYSLSEENRSDFTPIYSPSGVTLNSGDTVSDKDFGNFRNGSIFGVKFEDKNGNGVKNDEDENLSDWKIFIDKNSNGIWDEGETYTITTSSGYSLSNLGPGTYSVCESEKAGWVRTYPVTSNCQSVTVSGSSTHYNANFGNFKLAKITVHKNVLGTNGTTDVADTTSFTAYLNGEDGKTISESTDAVYDGLTPGKYTVTEATTPSGYSKVSISNDGVVNISSGGEYDVYVVNKQNYAHLTVTKVVVNRGGSESKVSDFPLYINSNLVVSGNDNLLDSGRYTVSEDNSDGFTSAISGDCDADGAVTLQLGDTKSCTITNTRDTGSITIIKDASPKTSASFGFTGNLGSFDLVDNGGDNTLNKKVFDTVQTGNYTITEPSVQGWALDEIICSGGQDVNTNNRNAVIRLNKDENITCTFYNSKLNTIIAHKYADNNENKVQDAAEANLSDWTMTLYKGSACDGEIISTSTTDASGNASFADLYAGEYSVAETLKDSWKNSTPLCQNVTLTKQGNETVNFGNLQLGNINVTKYNDANGNGVRDEGESVMSGWTINLSNGASSVTGESGKVTFSDLTPNAEYDISENMQDGWYQTNISCDIESSEGTTKITAPGEAYGHHGACGGWNSCGDAATCAQWACEVKGFDHVVSYGDQKPCTEFGNCNLFYSRGSVQMNWGNWCPVMGVTDIVCSGSKISSSSKVNLKPGDNISCSIGNRQYGSLSGYKWEDANGNHERDCEDSEDGVCEQKLASWKIFIDKNENRTLDEGEISTETNSDGNYQFTNLKPGEYSVCEQEQTDWLRMYPIETNCQTVTVRGGSNTGYVNFGNQFIKPVLTISKSNNASGNKTPGDAVTYRILVSVADSDITSLTVKDLLPKGFVYRPGSYQAKIGGVVVPIDEPVYHSPGTWIINHLVKAGQEVELLYTVDINSDEQPGKYLDVAWAQGTSLIEKQVMALADDSSKVDTNFAGTQVSVIKDQTRSDDYSVEKKEEKTGQVLGASTSLPATGANEIWLMASLLSLYFGIKLVRSSKSK